jgi:hypothetical protein
LKELYYAYFSRHISREALFLADTRGKKDAHESDVEFDVWGCAAPWQHHVA